MTPARRAAVRRPLRRAAGGIDYERRAAVYARLKLVIYAVCDQTALIAKLQLGARRHGERPQDISCILGLRC
jgi:hypothetical protein